MSIIFVRYLFIASALPKYPLPVYFENQMRLRDIYALARIGSALTIEDFEPFDYMLTGDKFTVRLYEIVGADSLYVTTAEDGSLEKATLVSRRAANRESVVDLREGFGAVAKFMDPLYDHRDITIEYGPGAKQDGEPELFYDDEYFGTRCRFYLNARPDKIYVVLDNGDRMTITRALEESRVNVEMLVAAGLESVRMIPKVNPLGALDGEFTVAQHKHRFTLNGEPFYPSISFMYVASGNGPAPYWDIDELVDILDAYGCDSAIDALRRTIGRDDVIKIARGTYISGAMLEAAGVSVDVGWNVSAYTPVQIITENAP